LIRNREFTQTALYRAAVFGVPLIYAVNDVKHEVKTKQSGVPAAQPVAVVGSRR